MHNEVAVGCAVQTSARASIGTDREGCDLVQSIAKAPLGGYAVSQCCREPIRRGDVTVHEVYSYPAC